MTSRWQAPPRSPSPATRSLPTAIACGLGALLLYSLSAAPGVVWQDSATHQWRIVTGTIENALGLALSHPLHYWLGRALVATGLGEPAHLLNLMSGFFGAVGVGGLAFVVHRLVRRVGVTILAAATLACAFIYWQMSSVTETYTLAAALMTIEWALLIEYTRRRKPIWLVAVFLVNGLHVADHLLGLLTLAPYGVFLLVQVWRRRVAFGWMIVAALLWVAAAAPYWLLCVQVFQRTHDLAGTLQSAFFGGGTGEAGFRAEVLNTHVTLRQAAMIALNLGYNFPSLALPIALFGMSRRASRPSTRMVRPVLLAQTVLILLFVVRYSIVDQTTFFVPVCVTVALWFGIGVDWLWQGAGRWLRPLPRTILQATPLLHIVCYCLFPLLAGQRGWLRSQLRHIPFRDEYRHFFEPWKFNDDSCQRLAQAVFGQVLAGDWILTDGTVAFPLAYTYTVHGRSQKLPEKLRIYSWKTCLTEPAAGFPTSDEMRAHLQAGRRVLVIPDGTRFYDDLFGAEFTLKKGAEIWWIELP